MAFEPCLNEVRLRDGFKLELRRPNPDEELRWAKRMYIGRRPLAFYVANLTKQLERNRVYVQARGNYIPKMLSLLWLLPFRVYVERMWLWCEQGKYLYSCMGILVSRRRRAEAPIMSGDRLIYEGGRWKVK